MCGISAIIDFDTGQDIPSAVLRMHAQIPHRGPDGERFLFVDTRYCPYTARHPDEVQAMFHTTPWRLGIGFRWLKIQDLEETAAQPMCSQDRAVWVVLNGEIYNFPELRAALHSQGYRFATQSDTEVVLAAYQAWGTGCFARFCGMWAMVIVDLRDQRLLISRDRFGIKPLFYCYEGTRLCLASEIKQIVALCQGRAQANLRAVCDFLQGVHWPHEEETFFNGVMALPPATYAAIDLAAPRPEPFVCQRYWELANFFCADARQALPFQEAGAELNERLRLSVAEHMAAQVPVGVLLSGGLDSSTVAAMLAEHHGPRAGSLPSFSLAFPGYPALDESPHIDAVATHLGLQNFKTTLDAMWVKEHMPIVTWAQEAPLIGTAWVAQYRTYQLAAAHGVRVVLDGQGADEILAGYPRHQHILLRDWLLRLRLRALARETTQLLHTDPSVLFDFTTHAILAPLWRRWVSRSPRCVYDWLSSAGVALSNPDRVRGTNAMSSHDPSRLNQMLYRDVQSGNLKIVLGVGDRNSMAHTIESRVPYLDHRLVEFAFQLPEHYKVGHGLRKRVLRHVAACYLPASVVSRRDRIGFGTPQWHWLQEHFREALYNASHSAVFRASPLCAQTRLVAFVDDFYAGRHRDATAIWRIYALWQWAEVYGMALG